MASTITKKAPQTPPARPSLSTAARTCRRKFLHYFPKGFRDPTYLDWERGYKWAAHKRWRDELDRPEFTRLVRTSDYDEIASRAVRVESRTNLIFSFEKMALRDALRGEGARHFARGLHALLHGGVPARTAFERWTEMLAALPHEKSRVFTWPVATVFGFLAQPGRHLFIKPNVMRRAAEAYAYPFAYRARPGWDTYRSALQFAADVRADLRDLAPRDMIDIQSFLWVLGSDEYPD